MKIYRTADYDKLHGGLADGKEPKDYDAEQLDKGIEVEMEHTDDPEIATEIAMDHLEESKDYEDGNGGKYYDLLEQMEDYIEDKIDEKLDERGLCPHEGLQRELGLNPGRGMARGPRLGLGKDLDLEDIEEEDFVPPFVRSLSAYFSIDNLKKESQSSESFNDKRMEEDLNEFQEDNQPESITPFEQGFEAARQSSKIRGQGPNLKLEPPLDMSKVKDPDEIDFWEGWNAYFDQEEENLASKKTNISRKASDETEPYNPWAVCTESVGREDKEKFERCVREIKKKNRKDKSSNRKIKKTKTAKDKQWIQDAVDEEDEGKFTAWCKRHGHRGVNQACIDEAAKEGGNAARMANFAVNANPEKWHYPKNKS